jgi:hypothetical protein
MVVLVLAGSCSPGAPDTASRARPDGGAGVGGGSGGASAALQQACLDLCQETQTCTGDDPGPTCAATCLDELSSCSDGEASAIDACATGSCNDFDSCMAGVACAAGGASSGAPDAGMAACAHDPCIEGGALDPSCSGCVDDVCDQDPFCCSEQWDQSCVYVTDNRCGC